MLSLLLLGLSMTELAVVTRPNGKVYRARKAIIQVGFTDWDEDAWVAILRTHDIAAATAIATPYQLSYLATPELGWLRKTIRDGEPWYEYDAVSGVPCVLFREVDDLPDSGVTHD